MSPTLVALLPLVVKYGTPIAAALAAYAAKLLREYVKAHVHSESLRALLLHADDAAEIAVGSVSQTYLAEVAEAAKDGVVTDAEYAEAKRRAEAEFRKQMGAQNWDLWVKLVFGGDEKAAGDALDARIEAKVAEHKRGFDVPGLVRALDKK